MPKKTLHVLVPQSFHAAVKISAAMENIEMGELIVSAICLRNPALAAELTR